MKACFRVCNRQVKTVSGVMCVDNISLYVSLPKPLITYANHSVLQP